MRVFVYEHPKSGDIFTITDPDLQLNQLDDVQRDVSELLAHGLPGSATSVPAEPAAAAQAPVMAPQIAATAENAAETSEPPLIHESGTSNQSPDLSQPAN